MPRTPVPKHLIHRPEEIEENARLFDNFVDLIPEHFGEVRELIASQLLENIRQRVKERGELQLPFSLSIRHNS